MHFMAQLEDLVAGAEIQQINVATAQVFYRIVITVYSLGGARNGSSG
jgi:hypothetical protein